MSSTIKTFAIILTVIAIGIATALSVDASSQIGAVAVKTLKESCWECIGECRITSYCPSCNDPAGYQSSSGKTLENGDVACNWLPNGTRIRIDGVEYTVSDYCGTDAIDIFIDTDECHCDINEYREVEIWKGENDGN